MSEHTPPTIPNRDAADARHVPTPANQTSAPGTPPSASWKRPTTASEHEPHPATTKSSPATPVTPPAKTGVSPLAMGVLIGLGVAIVALLIVLVLK